MFGKCNQIYWVCPASTITSLNSGVWIIVPLGGWGAPKPQTVMRRNKNIHIPKCVSMVYDDFLTSKPQTSDTYGFGSHAQTVTLSTAVTCFEDFLIYTGTPSWENDCVYVIPITKNHKSFHQFSNKKSDVRLIAHSTLSIIQFECFSLNYITN